MSARGRGARGDREREPEAPPSRALLHDAALRYLTASAASASSVTKALERRVAGWAKRAARQGRDEEAIAADAARAREEIPHVLARLRELGLVNDEAFASARAQSLSRQGRSRRAISAHLVARGVTHDVVREAVGHERTSEIDAALAFAKKRRIGPFARELDDEDDDRDARRERERKALGAMARAGFDYDVCERALRMDRESAEQRLRDRR